MTQEETKDVKEIIRVQTLLNAKLHDGEPQTKPIMGKVFAAHKDLGSRGKEISKMIREEVEEVKKMSMDEIQKELDQRSPDAEKEFKKRKQKKAKKHAEKRKQMTELPNAKQGEVVLRYAPDPSKYPHLGQATNYLINYIYADKYDGKVVLRFDDTNPANVKHEYYEAVKEGLEWIGAEWDEEHNASDYMEEYYDTARELIKKGDFYICFCEGQEMADKREAQETCNHRGHSVNENLEYFEKMVKGEYEPGDAIIRLVGEMGSDNPVMRDPVMFRLVDEQHPKHDKMYHVMPLYDFESPYLDWKLGITHIIRSGEFGTMRIEQQSYVIEKLGGEPPEFIQFGRINIQGCPTKGRVIRDLVQRGVVEGWDDIRLITLVGLRNRGIHPQTPRRLVEEVGMTSQNTTVAWSKLEAISRQLLEPESKRLFYVPQPVKLTITGAEEIKVEYPFHPDHPEYGNRTMSVNDTVYVAQSDVEDLEQGDIFRLKDLYNVEISSTDNGLRGKYIGEEILEDKDKIQWVSEEYIEATFRVPDLLEKDGEINEDSMSTMTGYIEPDVEKLNDGEIVQLERVGFAKIGRSDEFLGHMVHTYQ